MSFAETLEFGKLGECVVATAMTCRGYSVLPVYEIQRGNYKGPRVFAPKGQRVAPDMFCMKPKDRFFVEAKRKSVFSWHRNTQRWVTGIDMRHYEDYKLILEETGIRILLVFLHEKAEPDPRDVMYCPGKCPTGMFAVSVDKPTNHENDKWGPSGMVYWAYKDLLIIPEDPAIKPYPTTPVVIPQARPAVLEPQPQIQLTAISQFELEFADD